MRRKKKYARKAQGLDVSSESSGGEDDGNKVKKTGYELTDYMV